MSFSLFFKLNANIYLRSSLAFIPAVTAVGFMFFGLLDHIKKWVTWLKFINIKTKEKMEKLFRIKNINDNLIYHKNKKIAVIKVEPINFAIKPGNEQKAISLSFQKFLNSLEFPIQILMTTESLDIDSYLKSLEKRVCNTKNSHIFTEYKQYMESMTKGSGILNRKFYMAIPETFDIEIQIKIVEERLNSLNLKTYRLNNEELKDLLAKSFNTNKKSFLPSRIDNYIDHIKIDGKFYRTVYAYGYPRIVETGFLDKLVSSSGNFDLSLHITPCSVETTLISINKELQKQRADLYSAKLKNQLNPSLEIKYKDTRKTLENLQKGQERLFNIGFYVNCKAENKKELDLLTNKIEAELNSLLVIPKKPVFRMIQSFQSCLPLSENVLKITRNITTPPLSAFFPFTSSFFKFDDTGIWFGINQNKIPIIRDIFKLSNANGICLATSGAGKSYLSKLFISRHLLNGTKVMIIDPQREYSKLVKKFNGQIIDLSRSSDTIINPLDLMGHNYPEKRLALMDLMPILMGNITEPQKSFIDKAITESYERKGIYMDDPQSWNNTPPVLGDVLDSLIKMEKRAIALEKTTIRSLINRLSLYVDGVFAFLNRHTNINFNNDLVCFDIGNMPKQVKPAIMFLILDYVYMKMKKDLSRKLLVIDESWSLLNRTEDASYIFEIVKTCRKFNLGLFLINQEVEGMLDSQAGRSVLANSSYTLLLKQKPSVIDNIQKVFNLSDAEKTHLLTSSVGEGILLMEDDHSKIRVVASKEEHKQITTNADELLSQQEEEIPEKVNHNQKPVRENKKLEVNIKIDENKGLFEYDKLSKSEREYLIKKRYREFSAYGIMSNKKEKYLIKPRFNESPQHFFLIYEIANYLKKFTDKIEIFETKKPDIVFQINNKKYAIEVETGKVYKTNKKQLLAKVRQLNKNYGNNWFFVVTDRKMASKYNKLGKTYDKRYIAKRILKIIKEAK